jgi:[ribosomal protein S5]-alanine N-acetyltransferase
VGGDVAIAQPYNRGMAASEPTIDCGACVLRAWRADDAASLQRHADDPRVSRALRDRFPSPYTAADAAGFLAGCAEPHDDWRFALTVDGTAVGGLGLHPGEDVHRHAAEVGYWLGVDYWGRGIMAAALRVVVPVAMAHFGLYRVHAGVYSGNRASMRLLERVGFRRDGVLPCAACKRGELLDVHVYSVTRRSLSEPVALNPSPLAGEGQGWGDET